MEGKVDEWEAQRVSSKERALVGDVVVWFWGGVVLVGKKRKYICVQVSG